MLLTGSDAKLGELDSTHPDSQWWTAKHIRQTNDQAVHFSQQIYELFLRMVLQNLWGQRPALLHQYVWILQLHVENSYRAVQQKIPLVWVEVSALFNDTKHIIMALNSSIHTREKKRMTRVPSPNNAKSYLVYDGTNLNTMFVTIDCTQKYIPDQFQIKGSTGH